MKNYESYTMQDFAQDEDFRDWVQGDSKKESFWMGFVEIHPEKRQVLKKAEQVIRAANVASDHMTEKEIRTEVELFIERASQVSADPEIRDKPKMINSYKRLWHWRLTIAAVALIVAGFGLYSSVTKDQLHLSGETKIPDLVTTGNASGKPLKILLADGSIVILSPKSQLSYPAQFTGAARIVYLKGQADFAVRRQGQTFTVYAGSVVTKVLGTRFTVKAFEKDKDITVQVQSGKVSVSIANPASRPDKKDLKGLIIMANQAAVFEKSISQLSKTVVENPAKLTKESVVATSRYEEVPLPVILRELEKTYGIPFQFDTENFQPCKITATLSNESLYEKLDILCKTVGANYEIVDGQIVLNGKGCRSF